MSKRQSKSAEFIGGFHYVERNHISPEEHLVRWRGHVDRWLRQLRSCLQQIDRLDGRSLGNEAEAKCENLLARGEELRFKLDGVLAKIKAVSGDADSIQHRQFRTLRAELYRRRGVSGVTDG